MEVDNRSPQEIQRSLHGTRRRIEDDLQELSRRMQARSESVPTWVKGASIAAGVVLVRKPLFRLMKAVAALSAPIVIPIIIGRWMERREEAGEEAYGGSSFSS